ncbi:MAG: PP2C family serine/threonine-protein phosphatase [Anaerolineales bacterium]|nr:PP2C family serine/threonine-protein phosphatase [Anaerolineales bacterium]
MKPLDKPHLLVGALSHPGEKRSHNEDRYSVTAYQRESDGMPVLLAVVADGIGGHQAGEVAAELTVEHLVEAVSRSDGRSPLVTLREAIIDAAQAVHTAAEQDSEREGMGSTVAAALVLGDRLYITYVGDSRIYLQRGDRILQISNDHTWVQEALDHKIITREEAEDHPQAHVLRRHIGGKAPPEPDQRLRVSRHPENPGSADDQGFRLQDGDRLLLCSDGLTDLVKDEEIAAELRQGPPEKSADRLVSLARERGGHDNITVVALEVPSGFRDRLPKKGCLRRSLLFISLAVLVGLLLALAAVYWLGWRPVDFPPGLQRGTDALVHLLS